MNREGFRNRLKQYKEAKGFDPQLSYWEWKQKYDSAPQPDSMPSQPQPDQSTAAPQPLDDRAHRWDNGYANVNRDPFDSPYDDSRYYDHRKPRFEFRKGDVHYSNPNVLKWMGRFGKVLRGGSLLGEAVQNLFPSEEAELIEDLRVKMDKQNKQLTGQEDIPKYDEGTDEVRDNTYVAPIEKEQVFIPATGATKFLQKFRKRNPRGGNLEIVSPEFDLLTLGRSIGNALYKNLPTDMVYRRTTQSEIDDILESGVFRRLPEGKVAGKGKTFTINGKTVTLHKKGGNAHGGKAFSKGEPWRGTTVTGTADETIVGIPGKGTQWKVGHHGDYSDYTPFENIEKGKGLWEPFNENGIVENVSTKGMRVFRPFTYGYKEDGLLPITGLNLIGENVDRYAEGGEVGDKKAIPTQEEYIAQQIELEKAAALAKSLSRTMPRIPLGEKRGERWNPHTGKVENIYELGSSCAYTFADNYGQNWMSSEDFRQNHADYGWKQVPWEQRQPGNAVLIVDDSGTAKHTMMYDSDNAQGQPLFNHSNGGHDESAIRKKAKYPHHNPYLTYEFVGTPADSTQWINDYKKIYGFAEGTDGVTGPPTYEQWYADMNQYNPTILDNASMYWSIEAAKKALHNEAMKLPGYAERWTEYYRSLPKNDPDINEFVDELWANENPNNVGLKNGKYYPHKSPEGGKPTIGPGFKIGSGSHRITKKQAERGMTKARLNQEARYIGKQHLNAVDQFINYGQTTNPADTVSPQIKMGLMDLRHQVGPLNEWGNLRQAVLNGDLEGIRKESTVTWNDDGKIKVDKRRKKIRDEKYFYYE